MRQNFCALQNGNPLLAKTKTSMIDSCSQIARLSDTRYLADESAIEKCQTFLVI